jgi:hypothetical protein
MEAANAIIEQLEPAGGLPTVGTSIAGSIPFVGGYAQRKFMSPEQQRYTSKRQTTGFAQTFVKNQAQLLVQMRWRLNTQLTSQCQGMILQPFNRRLKLVRLQLTL